MDENMTRVHLLSLMIDLIPNRRKGAANNDFTFVQTIFYIKQLSVAAKLLIAESCFANESRLR